MELNFIFKYYDREFFESGIGGEREVKSDRKSRPQFKKPKEKTQRLFLSPPWTNALDCRRLLGASNITYTYTR